VEKPLEAPFERGTQDVHGSIDQGLVPSISESGLQVRSGATPGKVPTIESSRLVSPDTSG
jgi:hypothetical protein